MTRAGLLIPIIALLGACAEGDGPTAAGDTAALAKVGTESAPAPSVTCYSYPRGTQYDVTVTWSRVATATVFIFNGNINTGGSYRIDLDHRMRKGTVSATVDFLPSQVFLGYGETETARQNCEFISS
jgi:hypothetical protein